MAITNVVREHWQIRLSCLETSPLFVLPLFLAFLQMELPRTNYIMRGLYDSHAGKKKMN